MRLVNLDEAAKGDWDIIVVGTSFAAMFFVHGINRSRKVRPSVLFIERGKMASHADQVADINVRRPDVFPQDNTSGFAKDWVATRMFGGNSNCWSACIPRFHPSDFKRQTLYGVDRDWPISYETLEPYYADVEDIMDAAGGGSEHILPRSRPFPFPGHKPSIADTKLREHDAKMWFAQPAARSNGGRRAQCCANGICTLCPVEAKFTVLNSLELFDVGEAAYLLDQDCRAVIIEGGKATGVMIRGGGRDTELRADMIALGANAISNAAILLRSGVDNPLIGRGLSEQASKVVTYNVPFTNYFGGTHITGHGYAHYDGAFVKDRASTLIEVRNDMVMARREKGKWLNTLRLKFIAGDIVNPDNRVTLKDDEPHLTWVGHSKYAHAGLDNAIADKTLLPFEHEIVEISPPSSTEAHIEGMTPMGKDAGEGVVDAEGRVFGVANLRVLGAGVFPTCSAANPTLTLSAIALRAGESV